MGAVDVYTFTNVTATHIITAAFGSDTPELVIAKTVTPLSAAQGDAITYTLVFSNQGVRAAATVLISDIIPVNEVTDLAFTASDPSITDLSVTPPYNWQMPALAVDATATITVTGRLTDYLPTGLVFTNTATITSTTPELHYANHSSSAAFTVACPDTYLVNTTADAGPGSLRQALRDVCTGGEVRFAPALTAGGPVTITLTSTELTATKHITLTGPGADLLTVSGNSARRVLAVKPDVTAIISGVTVSNGFNLGPGSGMHNQGALTLINTVFANNRAINTGGGGLYNTGVVTLTGGAFRQNQTNAYGGGIHNTGSMTLRNTAFSANTASARAGALYNSGVVTVNGSTFEQGQGATGGAIYTDGSGSLTLQDTTLVNNIAYATAGAIYAAAPITLSNCTLLTNTANIGGALYTLEASQIANTTFAYNRSSGPGGAIHNNGPTAIVNSTFVSNSAPIIGGGIYNTAQLTITHSTFSYNKGGIYNDGALNFTNTILANSVPFSDCTGTGTIGANTQNLIEDGSCSPALSGDPLLGELDDYGGATWTLPLLPGSPAINAGNADGCLPTDQRGVTRTPATCDIGAYETQGFTLTQGGGDNQRAPVDFTFSRPLTLTVAAGAWQGKAEPVGGGQVTFVGPVTGAGVTPITKTTSVDVAGAAAINLTANSLAGVYSVTASLLGGNAPISYTLTNFVPTTTTVTSDPPGCGLRPGRDLHDGGHRPYGAPTGSVTFTFTSDEIVAPLVEAVGVITRSDLAVGDHVVIVQYGGAGYFDPSQSDPYTQTVVRAGSAITVTTAPNPAVTTDSVTFTATVTALPPGAGMPTGSVTFTVGATVFTATLDANGVAVAVRNDLAVGVHAVSADYPGDTNFTESTVNGADQVVQATLAVAMDGTGAGSLASAPAGIDCGATCSARFDPNTVVTVTATPLISTTFTGWSGAAVGPDNPAVVTLAVDKALTATFTIKSYVITPTAGVNGAITPATPQTVIYDAGQRFDIVPAAHHHIVDVAVDNVSVGAVSAYTFTNVIADHILSATFAIDTHTLAVTKTGAGVGAIAQEPAGTVFDYGTVVTLTATPVVTATFTGWSGDATGTTNPLPVTIDGDKAITGTFIIFQLPTTTTLQTSLNPAYVNDQIVFTAQVEENRGPFGASFLPAGGPTGQIHISDPTGAISLTGNLVNGSIQLAISTLEAGNYDVTAAYSGDTYHEPSVSNLVVQVVDKHSTTTSLALSPNPAFIGNQIYFTATVVWDLGPDAARVNPQGAVAGPTGSVDFMADGTLLANAKLVDGVAHIQRIAPVTGTSDITAHYQGDRASETSVSEDVVLRIRRRPTVVTLTAAPNPSKVGQPVIFTATVHSAQSTQVDLSYQPGIYSQADSPADRRHRRTSTVRRSDLCRKRRRVWARRTRRRRGDLCQRTPRGRHPYRHRPIHGR
ncbi:MAG: Ig-like domain repeat protein [Anaerolineales bacterium]|nr:Ig-like domain repeat protein [Anaerolineales bacterium]